MTPAGGYFGQINGIPAKKRREGGFPSPVVCECSLPLALPQRSQEQKQDEEPDDVLPPEGQDDHPDDGKRASDDPLDAEAAPGVVVVMMMNMATKPSPRSGGNISHHPGQMMSYLAKSQLPA